MKAFRVALVGRPNVGKSSLFNALLGYRRTIVLNHPGTTLDVVTEHVDWGNGRIDLTDSFGIWSEDDISELERVVKAADVCIFVVDAISGPTPFDKLVAKTLLTSKKPVLLAVNKTDSKKSEVAEAFLELGFEDVTSVSASHRRNLESIKEWCVAEQKELLGIQESEKKPEKGEVLTIAFVGRPNAGKSTLMNRLCGRNVSRVSPEALTTRDPITCEIKSSRGLIRFVDTAGIRRPRSQDGAIEIFSVQAAQRMIRNADVVFLLIASHEPISDQDVRLLNLLEKEGRACAVLLNFWDKLDSSARKHYLKDSDFGALIKNFPTLTISGKTGDNVDEILPLAWKLRKKAERRVSTSQLNRIVEKILMRNPPPARGTRNFNILYASQVSTDPPTFVFFMNRKEALAPAYQRYLTNTLRKELGLTGQSIRIHFRGATRH